MLKFKIYIDKKKEYRWMLVATNGKIISDSGEGYKRESACLKAVNKIITKIIDGNFKVIAP